ncbi:MAG: hypothetical protein ACT4OP_05445 [Actinomycetota bacterium]
MSGLRKAGTPLEEVVWERVGAATGLLFVALFLVALGLDVRDFPDPGIAGPGLIATYVETQRPRMGLVAVLLALSWTAFLWFLGSLRTALARVEASTRLTSVAYGAGLLAAGLFFAFTGLQLEILFADFTTFQKSAITSRWTLFDAAGGLFGITSFPRAVFLGAASLVILRHGGLPRWLGWLGVAGALLNLAGGFDYLSPPRVSFSLHPLADLMTFLLWTLLVSGLLVSRPSHVVLPQMH